MSGHSKWHNIKIRKAKVDAEKGKLFGKLAREIIIAAREGGGDPEGNSRLRLAVQRAKDAGMPQNNIQRAVKRGTGELEGEVLEEAIYEGYGPHGVALMVHVMTDNRNRTVPELRRILSKNGGNLGEAGCVKWIFERRGLISISAETVSEDELLELVLDAGAEDLKKEDDSFEIYTQPEDLETVRRALEEGNIAYLNAEVTYLPQNIVPIDGAEARGILRLMEALDEHPDVQQVYANFDIPDELIVQEASLETE